jgi:hypothetical protein
MKLRGACLILISLVALVSLEGRAVDFRWTSGFGQGALVAQVRNQAGSVVHFSCNQGGGSGSGEVSLLLEIHGATIPGSKTYQFVVDGKNYPVILVDGWLTARARFEVNGLMMIAHALVSSRSPAFVVEVPEAAISERFSLLNVRDALGPSPGKTLADCG